MELYQSNSSPNIIRVIGKRSIICAGHVSCIRDTTSIINFVLKCEGEIISVFISLQESMKFKLGAIYYKQVQQIAEIHSMACWWDFVNWVMKLQVLQLPQEDPMTFWPLVILPATFHTFLFNLYQRMYEHVAGRGAGSVDRHYAEQFNTDL